MTGIEQDICRVRELARENPNFQPGVTEHCWNEATLARVLIAVMEQLSSWDRKANTFTALEQRIIESAEESVG